jgi:cytochrome b subunit of formate dehydrogenase
MSPASLRRAVHAAHAVTALALIASGLVIEFPELRVRLIGGYALWLMAFHDWTGVPFMALPLCALAIAPRPILRDLLRRLGPPDRFGWKKLHILASLLLSVVLALTGTVLWIDPAMPLALFDALVQAHVVATWLLIASLPVHLFEARRRIVDRVAVGLGLREPPELVPGLPDEEEG